MNEEGSELKSDGTGSFNSLRREICSKQTTFVCEGEKDADTAAEQHARCENVRQFQCSNPRIAEAPQLPQESGDRRRSCSAGGFLHDKSLMRKTPDHIVTLGQK